MEACTVSSDKESVRNDRDRRVGQTYSVYLHFDEKDALDAEAAARETTPNSVLRDLLRGGLGL